MIASHISKHGIELYPYWLVDKTQADKFNSVVKKLNLDYKMVTTTNEWLIPKEYQNYDIEHFVLSKVSTTAEVDRINYELTIFKQHQLIDLLRMLKYLVDTFRKNNVLFGIGRGSSTHSFVLYVLGVHKVNSLLYNLDFNEFLQ